MPAVFSGEDVFFGRHRLGKLVEALLIKPTDKGKEFVFSQIDALPNQRPPPVERKIWTVLTVGPIGLSILLVGFLWLRRRVIRRWRFSLALRILLIFVAVTSLVLGCAAWHLGSWLTVRQGSSARGVFLRDMLQHTQKNEALSTAVKERMSKACLNLSGPMLAETVYAMVLAGVATPDELEAQLTRRRSAEMLAFGLFFAGNYESYWWQHERAYAFWDKALSLTKNRRLKAAIDSRIRSSERTWRRRTTDPN
jgi:hypothetical protein